MPHDQAELHDKVVLLRREFELSRQMVAEAVARARRLTAHGQAMRGMIGNAAAGTILEDATTRIEHLSGLIDAVLDYSRLSLKFPPSKTRLVDVNQIVGAAVQFNEARAAERHQTLAVCTSDERPLVAGDPLRLQHAVVNLLHNAIRYTPDDGGIQVSVSVAGGDVSIAVRDTGQGIRDDELPRIFEPFAGGSGSRPGVGIGLALVRRIADMHGGSVSAVSAGPGQGSIFTLLLPRAKPRGTQ